MTQPFADALTWVPKSRALGSTLGRAHDLARAQNHSAVTLEHLLLSLVEDPDASSVLLSCNIDLLKLNASIAEYVHKQPAGSGEMPEAAPELRTILEYAVAAARQSRRNEINGAIVLAAIIGEGKSEAAKLLLAAGLKFQDTVAALKRSNAAQRPAAVESQPTAEPATQPQAAPLSAVQPALLQTSVGEPAASAAPTVAPTLPPPVPSAIAAVAATAASKPVTALPPGGPVPGSGVVSAVVSGASDQYALDDDPVTTARRRIAAIRSGQIPPPPSTSGGAHASMPHPMTEGSAAVALSPAQLAAHQSDWAPAPMQQAGAAIARPVRMPPPIPPVAEAPVRRIGVAPGSTPASAAPWSEGVATDTAAPIGAPGKSQALRPPIEPADLIDAIPAKLSLQAATTIEIRIPRSALASAGTPLASGAQAAHGRSPILTRTIAIRLRAPAGGMTVENASPETQWFDSKAGQHEEDEVRWRWVVTPRSRGRLPLQISMTMRTVAADGMIVETTMPDQQASVRVSSNPRAAAKTLAKWCLAALIGGVLTLLASVGVAGLLGRVFH